MNIFSSLIQRLARQAALEKLEQELQSKSDYQLRDIGLHRSEIHGFVRGKHSIPRDTSLTSA
jgi:uncharacterized protein YjiS (DUF1127 family)